MTALLLVLVIALLAIAGTVFWIWTIVDCATNEPAQGNDKIVWIIVILITNVIGALIYHLARRPKRIQMYGK